MNERQGLREILNLVLDAVQKNNTDKRTASLKQCRNRPASEPAKLPKRRKRYKTFGNANTRLVREHPVNSVEAQIS